jgi:hypothetical protein
MRLYVFFRRWFGLGLTVVVLLGCGASYSLGDFREYSKKDRESDAKMNPVIATRNGVHKFDGYWPDYTLTGRKRSERRLEKALEDLNRTDTTGWPVDDQIDYMIQYNHLHMETESGLSDVYRARSPLLYLDLIYWGLNSILVRDPNLSDQTIWSVLSRICRIPDFLSVARENLRSPNYPDCQYSQVSVEKTTEIIKGTCNEIVERYPERNAEISSLKNKSVLALRQFAQDASDRAAAPESAFSIGKVNYEGTIHDLFFLDFGCDSIMNLAAVVFHKADSLQNYYRERIPADEEASQWHHDIIISPEWDSVVAYADYEKDLVEQFLDGSNIIPIPDGLLEVKFARMPSYLESKFFREEEFGVPGPLDTNRTAYYYISESESWEADDDSPFGVAPNSSFVEDMVENSIREYYFPSQMAFSNPSIYRRLSTDLMYIIGWNYYIGEVVLQKGLFENQHEMLADYYGELKTIALQTIVDVGFNLGRFDVDESRKMLMDSLQIDSSHAEFKTYFSSICPYNSLSCVVGRELFRDMRDNAEAREGPEFDLGVFHRKILSEGAIPPALIARKYGWTYGPD